jgi:predicted AAA+ superfamily ATPase
MKLATLKAIEKALEHDTTAKYMSYQKACDKVKEMYQKEVDDPENFKEEELNYWKESKKKHLKNWLDAKGALDDFLEHDWN